MFLSESDPKVSHYRRSDGGFGSEKSDPRLFWITCDPTCEPGIIICSWKTIHCIQSKNSNPFLLTPFSIWILSCIVTVSEQPPIFVISLKLVMKELYLDSTFIMSLKAGNKGMNVIDAESVLLCWICVHLAVVSIIELGKLITRLITFGLGCSRDTLSHGRIRSSIRSMNRFMNGWEVQIACIIVGSLTFHHRACLEGGPSKVPRSHLEHHLLILINYARRHSK